MEFATKLLLWTIRKDEGKTQSAESAVTDLKESNKDRGMKLESEKSAVYDSQSEDLLVRIVGCVLTNPFDMFSVAQGRAFVAD